MEEDRAQTDLGIAADIEEAQNYEAAAAAAAAAAAWQSTPSPAETETEPGQTAQQNGIRQPKKRFVGRRAATEAAAAKGAGSPDQSSGAVQGTSQTKDQLSSS